MKEIFYSKCLNRKYSTRLKIGETYKCEKLDDNVRIVFYNENYHMEDAYNMKLKEFIKYFISIQNERKLKLKQLYGI